MATRTPSTSGNWRADDADTWGLGAGVYPAATDHVEIDGGHTVTLGEDNTCASIRILSTLVGGGHTLTLQDGASQAVIFNHDGTIHAGSDLNVTITGTTSRQIDSLGTNNVNNLTIAPSSGTPTFSMITAMTLDGGLTITGGTLDTDSSSNHALTVAGTTQVTGTLTCNASTISLGSGLTSGWGLDIQSGGTFTGGTGTHTIGSIFAAGGGTRTITLSSGATTINSKNTGNGFTINLASGATFNHGGGTVTMTYAGNTLNQLSGGTLAFNTFTYNASGRTLELRSPMSCAGNLTLTAGTLDTKSGTNHALTVTGDCVVTGTLTLNDSTVAVGALRAVSGAAITQGSSGTLELTTGSNFGGSSSYSFKNEDGTSDINLGGTLTQSAGTYFDPRTAPTYASVLNNVVGGAAAYWVGKVTIGGNFTVNAGDKWQTYGGSDSFIVDGDVTLNGTLQATAGYLAEGSTGEMKFGSLTINSGGKYTATPLTTTITDEVSATDYSWLNSGGTFTHNNGKVLLTEDSNCKVKENAFYDFELNLNSATTDCDIEDASGNTITFYGDLTITRGRMQTTTTTDEIIVHGNTYVAVTHATLWHDADQATNKITHHGLVTNLGTYKINDGTTVKMNGGIRQLGTLSID